MNFSAKLTHLIPCYDQVKSLYTNDDLSSHLAIFSYCYTVLDTLKSSQNPTPKSNIDRAFFLASSLKDKIYEIINIGHWSEVDENIRKAFTVATFLDVFFRLHERCDRKSIEKALYLLDFGLMLGCPLQGSNNTTLTESIRIIEEHFPTDYGGSKKKQKTNETSAAAKRCENEFKNCPIDVLQRPSLETFQQNYFDKQIPALILDCIDHWPAVTKWKQSDYLLSVAGERTVPIEIGSHYTNENWSQDLVKFKEFLNRQILMDEPCDRVEYLAQHNLFDQITALRNDISIPEYCCTGKDNESVDIKAWLGPKGTISPMHYDPKHNLLCQVFGYKKIILAAPQDSLNLYPHETEMLKNTTQIDAENVDMDKYPLCSNVKFLKLNLYEGEMLYIPPRWWHYVRSLEKSFSTFSIPLISEWETAPSFFEPNDIDITIYTDGSKTNEYRGRDIMVLLESVVSGHQVTKIRERLADKIEVIRFDPYIQRMSLYRERKRVRSM